MLGKLLSNKRILIIDRWKGVYDSFIKELSKYSKVYFLSVSKNIIFKKNVLITRNSIRMYRNFYAYLRVVRKNKIKKEIEGYIKMISPDVILAPSTDEIIPVLAEIKHKGNLVRKINLNLLSKKYQEKFSKLLNIPTINNLNSLDFPVVLKPEYGRGAKLVFMAKSKRDLDKITWFYKNSNINYTVQKYIERDNFVVYNIFSYGRKRVGFIFYNNKNLISTIKDFYEKNIVKFFVKTGYEGFISFQCRIKNGKVYTLEINPRIHHLIPSVHEHFLKSNENNFLINRSRDKIKKVFIPSRLVKRFIERDFLKYQIGYLRHNIFYLTQIISSIHMIIILLMIKIRKKPNM